jgi:hypothetical protein
VEHVPPSMLPGIAGRAPWAGARQGELSAIWRWGTPRIRPGEGAWRVCVIGSSLTAADVECSVLEYCAKSLKL